MPQTTGSATARWRFPSSYWFPLAAAWAALALPASVLGQLGLVAMPPGLAGPLGHAHEMLFGFALAVVAGYTLMPGRHAASLALLVTWLLARLTSLGWPASGAAALLNGFFAVGLAWQVAPVYLRAAKWRNRSVAVILMALAVAVLAFHAAWLLGWRREALQAPALFAVLVLSALMYFMSGRILAPAIAGHVRRGGSRLRHVVQPKLEGLALAGLAPASLGVALGPRWHGLAGLCLAACAAVGLLRMLRWRAWLCWDKPDLLAVLAGHAWLLVGWLLLAWALWGSADTVPMLHAITVGALGTLTWSIMLRTQLFRAHRATDALPWSRLAVAGLAVATVLRLAVDRAADPAVLVLAATLWSTCYAVLLVLLLGMLRRRPRMIPS